MQQFNLTDIWMTVLVVCIAAHSLACC